MRIPLSVNNVNYKVFVIFFQSRSQNYDKRLSALSHLSVRLSVRFHWTDFHEN